MRIQGASLADLDELRRERASDLERQGVVGTWLGLRRRKGRRLKERVIVAAVGAKVDSPTDPVPPRLGVGRRYVGTDVVALRHTRVENGQGASCFGDTDGTLACVARGSAGQRVGLTAAHVCGDVGTPVRVAGVLAGKVLRAHRHDGDGRWLDAGIFDLGPDAALPGSDGGPPGDPFAHAEAGWSLLEGPAAVARGAATGPTRGVIEGLDAHLSAGRFDLDQDLGVHADVVLYNGRGLSRVRDSGMLWTVDGRPLAVHWGGSPGRWTSTSRSRYGFATGVWRAEHTLGIQLSRTGGIT